MAPRRAWFWWLHFGPNGNQKNCIYSWQRTVTYVLAKKCIGKCKKKFKSVPRFGNKSSNLYRALALKSPWFLRPVGHQTCQLRVWKPGFLSQVSSAKHPQPEILSQESSARFLSQESSVRVFSKDSCPIPQLRFICSATLNMIKSNQKCSSRKVRSVFGLHAFVMQACFLGPRLDSFSH